MASLRDIRRRIRSVRNIAQITRAMQMVAASRMRRAQQRVLASRPYSEATRIMLMLCYVGGAAAIAAVVVASVALGETTPWTRPDGARLTAFTVTTQADGASILTLRKGDHYRLDPDALRRALADHHIPAVVRLNSTCDSAPSPQSGLNQVVSPANREIHCHPDHRPIRISGERRAQHRLLLQSHHLGPCLSRQASALPQMRTAQTFAATFSPNPLSRLRHGLSDHPLT